MKTLKFNLENNTSRVLNAVNRTLKSIDLLNVLHHNIDENVLGGETDLFFAESCIAIRHLSEPDCNKVKGLIQIKMKENAFEQLVSKFKNECKHEGVEVEDNFKWVTLEDGKRIRVLEEGKEFKIKWSSWCVSREFGEHREVCKSTVKPTLGQACGQMWTKDEEAINVWAKENALSFVGDVKKALWESFDKKFNRLPFGVMWNSPRVDFSNPNDKKDTLTECDAQEKSFKKVVLLREEDNCVMEIDVWGFCEETFEHNNDLFLISEKANPTADVKKNRDLNEAGVVLPAGLVTSADLLRLAQRIQESKKFKKAWGDLMDSCNNVEDLLKLLRNQFTFGFDVEVVENIEFPVLAPQHLSPNSEEHHSMQNQFGVINRRMDELILKKLNVSRQMVSFLSCSLMMKETWV